MVRVPKLPLSMTAVDSYTPSSSSTTDMVVRMPLWITVFTVQLFCNVTVCEPPASIWPRPSIEAVGYQTRQPLPRTARSGNVVDPTLFDMTRGNGAHGTARAAPKSFE